MDYLVKNSKGLYLDTVSLEIQKQSMGSLAPQTLFATHICATELSRTCNSHIGMNCNSLRERTVEGNGDWTELDRALVQNIRIWPRSKEN